MFGELDAARFHFDEAAAGPDEVGEFGASVDEPLSRPLPNVPCGEREMGWDEDEDAPSPRPLPTRSSREREMDGTRTRTRTRRRKEDGELKRTRYSKVAPSGGCGFVAEGFEG